MQVKLKKHASRIVEAMALARKSVSGKDYQKDRISLMNRYDLEPDKYDQMMTLRQNILDEFNRAFEDKKESLEFFFKRRSDMFSVAQIFSLTPFFQAEKRRCRFVLNEDKSYSQIMIDVAKKISLLDDQEDYKVSSLADVSLILDGMDIEDQDKWLLQVIYINIEKYMKRFCLLVNQIVEWLGTYEDEICKEEESFYEYWNEIIKKNQFKSFLTDKYNIAIPAKINIIWVTPAFFSCTMIDNHIEDNQNLYVDLGMCVDNSFSFDRKYETVSSICGQLKIMSDPSKFEILKAIKERPYYGSELAKLFKLSTPTISHHVQTLENAGFIKVERKENKTYYSLDNERVSLFISTVRHQLLDIE